MSEQTNTYSGDQVSIVWGAIIIDGFAEDEFCSIEHKTPRFASKAGTNGHVVRSQSNDFRATVKIRLMANSATNDALQAKAAQDRLTRNAVSPLTIRDQNGRSLHQAEHAWIESVPGVSYAREASMREWVIEVADLKDFVGGM